MKLIEFDTRDKKPKLYSLLAVTLAAAAAIAAIALINPPEAAGLICLTIALYCLAAAADLLYTFREQIRYNPYSYNTIFYFGFAVFAFFAFVSQTFTTVRIFGNSGYATASTVINAVLFSARNYIIISAPFLFVFCAGLCVSNFSLLRHEGKKPVNLLGIVLSLLIIAGEVFILTYDFAASGSQTEVMLHDIKVNVFCAVFLYFECMLIGTIAADAIVAKHEPEKNKDYVIVLGCGLKKDGTPTPILKGRVDRALAFVKEQEEQTGKKAIFITSGGKGTDERNSESRAMKNYLLEQGVPEDRIIEEDRSRTTYENMKYSKEIILREDPQAKIAFATTNFHVFRSGLFARRFKMRAVGMGAETKWYFWPNAAVREFAGLIINHVGKQLIILGSMIAFYTALTVIAYNL